MLTPFTSFRVSLKGDIVTPEHPDSYERARSAQRKAQRKVQRKLKSLRSSETRRTSHFVFNMRAKISCILLLKVVATVPLRIRHLRAS